MRIRVPLISLALMAAVVSCSKPSPVASGANTVTALPAAANRALPRPAGGPPATEAAVAEPAPKSAATVPIPADFHGRWGLTPRDCTTALGDAKGLLVVNDHELRFYESRAVPTADAHLSSGVLTGEFRFTGEGQTWTTFERLEREQNTLVRTESDPTASFTYVKC